MSMFVFVWSVFCSFLGVAVGYLLRWLFAEVIPDMLASDFGDEKGAIWMTSESSQPATPHSSRIPFHG